MSTPVVMPQMGESIAEGTIVRWIKKVGDTVDRDEPLFEISTDKVDAEIPSPAAGTLLEIAVKEGETVPINSVVATIGAAGEVPMPVAPAAAPVTPPAAPAAKTQADGTREPVSATPAAAPASPAQAAPAQAAPTAAAAPAEPAGDANGRQRSSPLVRKIAQEHGVDIGRIAGSGTGGRVTKQDILSYIDSGAAARAAAPAAPAAPAPPAPGAPGAPVAPGSAPVAPGAPDLVPLSVMRKKIAEHMVMSKRTSAHVYTVFEVDYSNVDALRKARRGDYERHGVKLTFTSFLAAVVVDCLRKHRIFNASLDGDNIAYRREINLGIAVALENGLIVPVVKRAEDLNVLGLSRSIADIAERARNKKLSPDEVQGGTFTLTNPGNFGAQFNMPIINQPQLAILGVGTIEKRVVVVNDMIAIRTMGYLTLGFDHRLIDGAVADQFMADVKKGLETFDANRL